jgi:MFS transporter, ACS family, allantoate permease
LIQGFGYTAEQSLLYGTPGGAVEVVTILFFLYFGDYIKQRILSSFMSLVIAELGIILIVGSSKYEFY